VPAVLDPVNVALSIEAFARMKELETTATSTGGGLPVLCARPCALGAFQADATQRARGVVELSRGRPPLAAPRTDDLRAHLRATTAGRSTG
jgi:hypothetical protein